MKIILVDIENYKCLKKVVIEPKASSLMLIGGLNKQGKSSVIDAITNALGGKNEDPAKPIREGEDQADIKLKLRDDAEKLEYDVHKRFLKSGTSSLKVTGRDGKVSSPQKVLDRIIGSRFLDPLEFSRLGDKEQKAALLKVVDIGINLERWEKERKEVFNERTDSNRAVKRYKVEIESNPHPGDISEKSGADMMGKVSELMKKNSERREAEVKLDHMRKEVKDYQNSIQRIKDDLAKEVESLEKLIKTGEAEKKAFQSMPDVTAELESAQAELKESSAKDEERTKKLAQLERHKTAKAAFETAEIESSALTAKLNEMDENKAAHLDKANMPVDGLSIGETGLIYNDIPLSQASGAEQLSVSLALAAAMSPNLQDIWVKDGALLDDHSLELVSDFAKKKGFRIWLERVGESDDGAIIMEEGSVRV